MRGTRGRDPWRPEEDALLHRYYPELGGEALSRLMRARRYRRSGNAIRWRACLLGVKYEPPRPAPPEPRVPMNLENPRTERERRAALYHLAERPGLTLEQYEAEKARILGGQA